MGLIQPTQIQAILLAHQDCQCYCRCPLLLDRLVLRGRSKCGHNFSHCLPPTATHPYSTPSTPGPTIMRICEFDALGGATGAWRNHPSRTAQYTVTLFLTSPKHYHFSTASSVGFDRRGGDFPPWSRESGAPTPSPVVR